MTSRISQVVRLRTPDGSLFVARRTQARSYWDIQFPEGVANFKGSQSAVVRELRTLAQLRPAVVAPRT